MVILLVWIGFALVVGIGANARDRSMARWFVLALIISPLLALIILLLLPNRRHETLLEKLATTQKTARGPPPLPPSRWGHTVTRVTVDRTSRPFEPDGVYAGIPYRVSTDGSIEAVMQGATVKFRDFDKFISTLGSHSKASFPDLPTAPA